MNNFKRVEQKLGFTKILDQLVDKCSTNYAKNRVREEQVSTNGSTIIRRLTLTHEMKLISMFEPSFPSTGYIDAIHFLKPLEVEFSAISLENLNKLNLFLENLKGVLSFFKNSGETKYPNLKQMASPILFFPEIGRRLDSILDKYGQIRDNATPELFKIRKDIRDKESSIAKRVNAILRKAQEEGLADEQATLSIRDGRALIPINSGNKRKLPGFVYDQSASGKTVFIEPMEIVELNNSVRELYFAEQAEIQKILLEFSTFIRPYLTDLINGARFIGEIDFIRAKGLLALNMEAGIPILSVDNCVKLIKGRHPILESTLKKEKKEIVPLTLTLTPDKHILVISGPNAGGKSVCLKTLGLLQYMFQWGALVPCSEISEFRIFNNIFIDIGDEQSIENDLSTYSSHLTNMKEIVLKADSGSLVLIDEFGTGTEPTAGGAIAETILSKIEEKGVFGVITTHYTNLKLYAGSSKGTINGAMQFDVANIKPLYKLEMGVPGNSFAFELARKIGLNEQLIKDAEERAGTSFIDLERQLRKISRNRRALDERLAKIKNTDKTLESITERYQKELSTIQALKKEIIEDAKREAKEILASANKQIEATIKKIKESQAEKNKTKEAREKLNNFKDSIDKERESEQDKKISQKMERLRERQKRKAEKREKEGKNEKIVEEEVVANTPLKVGDKVKVKNSDLLGEVTLIGKNWANISIGSINSKMQLENIEKISNNEFTRQSKVASKFTVSVVSESITQRKLDFKTSIDIRGVRLMEALDIVTRFVDDAMMVGVSEIKILHGKGNGILKEEIRKYLKTVPGVIGCRDEDIQFGGSGITIVTLD